MARLTAFSLFVCAAFAWSLPWLDRVGTAALGFGFLALTVGRGPDVSRPSLLNMARQALGPPVATPDPLTVMLRDIEETTGVRE